LQPMLSKHLLNQSALRWFPRSRRLSGLLF
jgi:hypothetical protein